MNSEKIINLLEVYKELGAKYILANGSEYVVFTNNGVSLSTILARCAPDLEKISLQHKDGYIKIDDVINRLNNLKYIYLNPDEVNLLLLLRPVYVARDIDSNVVDMYKYEDVPREISDKVYGCSLDMPTDNSKAFFIPGNCMPNVKKGCLYKVQYLTGDARLEQLK